MTDDHGRQGEISCPDPKIHVALQRLSDMLVAAQDERAAARADVLGVKEEVRILKEYQRTQNSKVAALSTDIVVMQRLEVDRNARQVGAQEREDRRQASFRWFVGIAITLGPAVAGVAFAVADRITQ